MDRLGENEIKWLFIVIFVIGNQLNPWKTLIQPLK